MRAQCGANSVADGSAAIRLFKLRDGILASASVALLALGGCMPATVVARPDPADPAAKVASVGYRSTIAPYTSLRPATPTLWRERNEEVTPKPRSGRESR